MQQKIIAFLKLSRVYFLPMSALPYFLGIGMARHENLSLNNLLLWGGLAVQFLIQLSVSFLNDYWDIETDRINQNRTPLSGGSGELTTGILHPRVGLVTGIILQAAALVLAFAIGTAGISWLALGMAIFLTQIYTAPPIKLCYRGLGEVSAASVAAFVVPAWAYSLQTGEFSGELFRTGLALLPFLTGMLIGIAVPDVEADRQVGKYTLPVIVGQQNIALLYVSVIGIGYVLVVLFLPLWIIALASVPLTWLAWRDLRHPVKNSTLGWTLLVIRPALVTLVAMLAALAGIWLGDA